MAHLSKERTLVIIKPDGVQRTLVGEIIKRYERAGLKLTAMKMVLASEDQVEKHYTLDPGWKESVGKKSIEAYEKKGQTPPSTDPIEVGDRVIDTLKKYVTSGPVVVMIWSGVGAPGIVRKITGSTEPASSDVGTIRGDFVIDSYQIADTDGRAVRNIVHASGSIEEAENEIAHWFNEDEIVDYRLVQEQILYDVNLDGILE